MGADLYIEKVFQKNQNKWQTVFDKAVAIRDSLPPGEGRDNAQKEVSEAYDQMYSVGYFRDSYNSTNVLNRLGLSWWKDISPMLNKSGNMPLVKEFRGKIAAATLMLPTEIELSLAGVNLSQKGNSLTDWHKYFADGHKELIAFLDEAIKLKQPIRCSL